MAEKIISPGVFTNEIDQSFLPAAVADIGAAIIGPTLKGPAGIPTVVTSFSDFRAKFGDVVKSGSDSFQFLTSHAAEEYLRNSDTLTVVRIMDGTFLPATASVAISGTTTGATFASASFQFVKNPTGAMSASGADEFRIGDVSFVFVSSSAGLENSSTQKFVSFGASVIGSLLNHATASAVANLRDGINAATLNGDLNISASRAGTGANLNGILVLSASTAGIGGNLTITTGSGTDNTATTANFVKAVKSDGTTDLGQTLKIQGGTDSSTSGDAFTLKTLADGTIMNNADSTGTTNSVLTSGSVHNVRFEVSNTNNKKGTFTLAIRAGNDNQKRKQTLETFTNVSLDPNTNNYVGKQIGDQRFTLRSDGSTKYLELSGSYPNKSRFVTVHAIGKTIDYLDENGNVRIASASGSLPAAGSGSQNGGFGGALDGVSGFDSLGNNNGTVMKATKVNFYEDIDAQTQGFTPSDLTALDGGKAYADALDLLGNQDEFDINLLLLPGLVYDNHSTVLNKAIDICESRGDCFTIIDPVVYAQNPSNAVTQAESKDSNFAAMYYPWVKVPDSQVAGTQRWVPPSVVLGGIYAFNDRVAHPWFAPAGLNRGGITTAIQAQRKLTQGERDTLYDSNVNPIATFPGQGVTVFGQKTLQKKASALDRINVRRLLIRVKKFIASSSRFLVFEQNTAATRRRFLGIVNPFLENVQAQSGLSAFRVVMDETNNTPDTIDRNQLIGQLFLQPTRTAEFIVLDFTIQPTGASFPE